MICFEDTTKKVYEYEFVDDYVRLWTKDGQLHEVISYKGWVDKYTVLSKLRTWKVSLNLDT